GHVPARDASTSPPELDAGTPGAELDAGAAGGGGGAPDASDNGEPDGGGVALPPLVPRQLCLISGQSVGRGGFPSLQEQGSLELEGVRSLAALQAVDEVHGEMFVQSSADQGPALDVFALDASGFDAPLRSIALHFDDARFLAITYDANSE